MNYMSALSIFKKKKYKTVEYKRVEVGKAMVQVTFTDGTVCTTEVEGNARDLGDSYGYGMYISDSLSRAADLANGKFFTSTDNVTYNRDVYKVDNVKVLSNKPHKVKVKLDVPLKIEIK